MRHAALLALALALPAPAMAEPQVFEMRLGGIAIGTLTYDATEAGAGWTTNLDNTPLGVADGVFAASSAPVTTTEGQDALRYRGVTETSRRNRVVEYVHAGGQVLSVAVTPDEDESAARAAGFTMRPVPGVPDDVGGSTWQSLQRGTGNVETDYLNGEIVRVAHGIGRSAPLNAGLASLGRRAARTGHAPGSISAEQLASELGVPAL